MEIKNGICNIGGTDYNLKYTIGVALEMEKYFGGVLLSLTAVENVKGACDAFVIMLKHAIKRHNEEWNENDSLSKYAIDEILFNYLKDTESAINIIKEVKEVIKRDRQTEKSRIKNNKKKNSSNKYIRNDLQTMVVTGTSLLNFSYSDVLELTIAEYSGYLNRYNEINYYDPDDTNDTEEEPDESYHGVGNLAELLDKQENI